MIGAGKEISNGVPMSLAESAGTDYVCILQLTDSHLFAGDSGDLLGLDTLDSLNSVIDLVLGEISRILLRMAAKTPIAGLSPPACAYLHPATGFRVITIMPF